MRWLPDLCFHQRDHVRIHLADDPLTSAIEKLLATTDAPLIHCPGTCADLFGLIGDQQVKSVESVHITKTVEHSLAEGFINADFKLRLNPGGISNSE